MRTIKFSHEYSKMPFKVINMDRTILLEVFLVEHKNNLSEGFLNYDTHIQGKNTIDTNSFYPLPEGKLLILLLKSFHRIPNNIAYEASGLWTTIRRWTPEKENYYRMLRGKEIKIKVTNK